MSEYQTAWFRYLDIDDEDQSALAEFEKLQLS